MLHGRSRGKPNPNGGGARFGSLIGGLVSVYLAAWFALFPVFQAAHFAFADHDHRFCREHRQLEDIPKGSAERLANRQNTFATRTGGSLNAQPTNSPQHVACTILNNDVSRDPRLLVDHQFSLAQAEAGVARPETLANPLPLAPIFAAPKTSPPLLAG